MSRVGEAIEQERQLEELLKKILFVEYTIEKEEEISKYIYRYDQKEK